MYHLDKCCRRDSAPAQSLPKMIAMAFEGRNTRQMRRPLGSHEPLDHRQPRISGHGDFAGTPRELGNLLDSVVPVSALARTPYPQVALGVAGSPSIHVDNGVALGNPFGGIQTWLLLVRSWLHQTVTRHLRTLQMTRSRTTCSAVHRLLEVLCQG